MKLGIMQPYFFPYIGYWQLMNAVDKYVIFDDVNYIKRGWINRNYILVNGSAVRINLVLNGVSQFKKINELTLSDDEKINRKILQTIRNAYKRAPYFENVYPMVARIMESEEKNLGKFLANSIREIHDYLEMDCELIMSSELEKNNELKGSEKILSMCELLQGDHYYNAIGGQKLYDKKEFEERGIELQFVQTKPIAYKQFKNEFVPNLSILDVLMFNSKDEVKALLDQYELK